MRGSRAVERGKGRSVAKEREEQAKGGSGRVRQREGVEG